jgi:hypothetical protein
LEELAAAAPGTSTASSVVLTKRRFNQAFVEQNCLLRQRNNLFLQNSNNKKESAKAKRAQNLLADQDELTDDLCCKVPRP